MNEALRTELPPSVIMYSEVLDIYQTEILPAYLLTELLAEYSETEDTIPGIELSRGVDYTMDASRRSTLELQSVGADSFGFEFIQFNVLNPANTRDGVQGYERQHDYISLDLSLFRDGSPYVMEGDTLDMEDSSHYIVLLGREFQPVIVQEHRLKTYGDYLNREAMNDAREQGALLPLTDTECAGIVEALRIRAKKPI